MHHQRRGWLGVHPQEPLRNDFDLLIERSSLGENLLQEHQMLRHKPGSRLPPGVPNNEPYAPETAPDDVLEGDSNVCLSDPDL